MKFGLSDNTIQKIHSVLENFTQIEEAVIYGSRAKGNFKPGSDIDLTLKGSELSYRTLQDISIKIDDLLLPYMFDISIFHRLNNPELVEHINRRGQVFYKKNSG